VCDLAEAGNPFSSAHAGSRGFREGRTRRAHSVKTSTIASAEAELGPQCKRSGIKRISPFPAPTHTKLNARIDLEGVGSIAYRLHVRRQIGCEES